jgi:hypothetical protein
MIKGCAPILAGFMLAVLFCLLLSLCGCKTQKVVERVEVPVPIVQEHTIESVKIDHVRDTLIQRDSIFHYVKGDTVLIEKWHYLQGSSNVVRVDTLIKTDSVEVPVEVVTVKTEQVEKPLTWWQKTKMGLGTALLVLLALGLGFGALRLWGKMKKL